MIDIPSAHAPEAPRRPPLYRHLYVQVLVAIVLGVIIGHFWPTLGQSLKPLGDGFIKLVKMIIAPVIFLTLVNRHRRHARDGSGRPCRRQGLRLFPVLLDARADRRPDRRQCGPAGRGHERRSRDARRRARSRPTRRRRTRRRSPASCSTIIPTTMVSALTEGSILQILFVAILFGDRVVAGRRRPRSRWSTFSNG